MNKEKIVRDFEILLEKDYALPHSCIEENENGTYNFYSDKGIVELTKDDALELLKELKY